MERQGLTLKDIKKFIQITLKKSSQFGLTIKSFKIFLILILPYLCANLLYKRTKKKKD